MLFQIKQKSLLENDGVIFDLGDRINLEKYMWDGLVLNDFSFFDSEEELF